jgi:hypothetical protein
MHQYLTDLAAEFTFLVIVIGASYLLIILRRKRLLRFFGVRQTRRLSVYFSLVQVITGGTLGTDHQPRSFAGNALAWDEVELLPLYNRLFNYIVPALQEQPGFLRRILLSDVNIMASPSPLNKAAIDMASSVLCFGSPGYNEVSKWVEQDLHALGRFTDDNKAIVVSGVAPFSDLLHGFVQRCRIGSGSGRAFYVAGPSAQATKASAYYLAAHWDNLYRRFGDRTNFCVILKAAMDDYRKSDCVLEVPEP